MSSESLTTLQRAALSLQGMRAKLDALEAAKTQPIAIVGMSCRFPGSSDDPESYWELLRRGGNAVTEVPAGRWDCNALYAEDANAAGKTYARHGAFLKAVDGFDAAFFGISPREARALDPQQRMLLEVAWEALERAGYANEATRPARTGVFVGMTAEDYASFSVRSGDLDRIDAYSVLGNGRSVAAGRIAYTLALQGPVLQLDTTCSSSLVAVHLAAQSLRNGECEMAVAGSVNLMLWPGGTIGFSQMNALSRDGRCKTLDAAADGYVRGEGCGVVVLRRLHDSLRDRDNILAVLRGSAINHDGRTSGLTVPNGLAQEAVVREALVNARLRPEHIDYVELHGTGTPLGDPIEVRALARAMAEARPAGRPLWIGSAKTNIGHLESAAGMAGLIKTVLALQHREIPPHLHFTTPNPAIPWGDLPLQVPRRLEPWGTGPEPRRAGVSAFGLSGTNAHVILEEAPTPTPVSEPGPRWRLFCLSARSQTALRELAARFAGYLGAEGEVSLEDICYTANTGRNHFRHRITIIADSVPLLGQRLLEFSTAHPSGDVRSGECDPRPFPVIVFTAPGDAKTTNGEGDDLSACYPAFRAALQRYPEHPQSELTAPSYALWQLWASFGVSGPLTSNGSHAAKPDFVIPLHMPAASRRALLDELSRLYLQGVKIDWKAVHAGGSNRKVLLPVYPFERQPFWHEYAQAATPQPETPLGLIAGGHPERACEWLRHLDQFRNVDPALISRIVESLRQPISGNGVQRHFYEVVWRQQAARATGNMLVDELQTALQSRLRELQQLPLVESSERTRGRLEAASVASVVDAFRQLGVSFAPGAGLGGPAWRERIGIQPRYERLVDRLLTLLADSGIVAAEDREWRVLQAPSTTKIEFPRGPEGELLRACGPRLADVLRGFCDPLELLFPEGDVSRAAAIYAESAAGVAMNALAASACSQLSRGAEGIRVLEIGAGTGSTTTQILSAVADRCAEYVYTDISPAFFSRARQRLVNYSFLSFRILDIERDPVAQGFPARHFDLIIAANVLHATADLAACLENARSLLAPGGHLVVIEGTVPVAWLDLTFGLTDGWWKFSDTALRPCYPLISPGAWQRVLTNHGFGDVAVTGANDNDSLAGQALIVARNAPQPRRWLVFEGSGQEGRHLAGLIRETGDACTLVGAGSDWQNLDRSAISGAVFFPALSSVPDESLPRSAMRICRDALRVAQNLLRRFHPAPPLWIVTRGATPLNHQGQAAELTQAALLGFSHACSTESREFHVGQIDLEAEASPDDAATLWREMRSEQAEQRIAFHAGRRHVARLVPASVAPVQSFSVSSAAMYLIAGGLGGLGLLSAEWLNRLGARHIALLGRSLPSEEARVRIHAMESSGTEILVRQVDLGDDAAVRSAIESISGYGIPLRGVIHSAGLLDDAALERQTPEKFDRVMAPKVAGAWALHEYTLDQPLDFFILFSSAVAVLGAFGQSNHAAASSFLDGLAAFRRHLGRPALSINWSTWSGVGAAARVHADEQLKVRGVSPIAPDEGMEALDMLVRRQPARTMVAPIDWPQFAKGARPSPFLEEVLPRTVVSADTKAAPDFRAPEPPARRERRLMAYLGEELAEILGFASAAGIDPDEGFFDQGMDSLTSVEFRERLQTALGIALPATATFDFPTVRKLAGHVLQRLQPAPPLPAGPAEIEPASSLAEMSESEAEMLLLSKLESFRY